MLARPSAVYGTWVRDSVWKLMFPERGTSHLGLHFLGFYFYSELNTSFQMPEGNPYHLPHPLLPYQHELMVESKGLRKSVLQAPTLPPN